MSVGILCYSKRAPVGATNYIIGIRMMPSMMAKMFFLRKPRRQFLVLHSPPACQTSSELPSRSLKPVLQPQCVMKLLGGDATIKYKTTNFQDATPENLKVALTSAGFSWISRNQKFNPSTLQAVDPVLSPADTIENATRTKIEANRLYPHTAVT